MEEPVLSLVDVSKSFGGNRILKNLSIDVYKGEFITLLGESGCGKTTTLRCIAGLETVDSGDVILNGVSVKELPPDKRNVNTVFQNYALFPHMNVFENIAYGPKLRGVKKDEIKRDVSNMLELVKMPGLEKRMPGQLSGGQRQRVAIARALINKPLILLLDEPLGALDMKLRKHMQTELKHIQAQTGVTCIYVTHDQDEALNMSSRIGVMNSGAFEQIGTPREIYETPASAFVAEFVGERNICPAVVTEQTNDYTCVSLFGINIKAKKNGAYQNGDNVKLAIHTDRAVLLPGKEAGFSEKYENILPSKIVSYEYSGSSTKIAVLINDRETFKIVEYTGTSLLSEVKPGDNVLTAFSAGDAVLLG